MHYVSSSSEECELVQAIGDIRIELSVESGSGNFCFYLIDYEALLQYQNTGSINRTSAIASAMQTTEYSNTIEINEPDIYGLILTTESEDALLVRIVIGIVSPSRNVVLVSLTLVIVGLAVGMVDFFFRKSGKS